MKRLRTYPQLILAPLTDRTIAQLAVQANFNAGACHGRGLDWVDIAPHQLDRALEQRVTGDPHGGQYVPGTHHIEGVLG